MLLEVQKGLKYYQKNIKIKGKDFA